MKKFILAFALLIGATSLCNTVEAQNINISINIGRQPAWGPVGYDYAGYYYFPDIDIYYDVNVGLFYFMDRGRWISARYLPYAYRNYDLYRLYKVVLNVHQPWRYHNTHYRNYAKYRGHKSVLVIRDSRDVRYRDSRNNRVVWYSSDKKSNNNHRDYNNHNNKNYSNNKKSNDNRSRNDNYRSDNRKDNNNKNNSDKNYNSGRDNNKSNNNNNSRQDRSRSDKNYSSPNNSSRDNSKNNQVRRSNNSSSSRSGEYRLASNSERGGRTR